jgi:thiamine biosynthesis lipoprotein
MLWFFLSLVVLMNSFFQHPEQNKKQNFYVINGYAQGTTYHIAYSERDSIVTKKQVDSIMNKIDSSLSLYKPYSLINRFNNSALGTVVDDHFIKVVNKSIDTYLQTDGVFDITVKPLLEAWDFGVKPVSSLPDSATINALKQCTGSLNLQVEKNNLLKKKPCVQIDCNGIAQGYSVDVLAGFLEHHNIQNYLVELGGEIRVNGKNQNGKLWSVGIESPGEFSESLPLQRIIHLKKGAVTTSGSYRNYYTNGLKKYTHIIDPLTGYPVDNGLVSVTVIAKDAITADAFDNSFMVMGLKRSLEFLAERTDMEAYFVYAEKDGSVRDTATGKFCNYILKSL